MKKNLCALALLAVFCVSVLAGDGQVGATKGCPPQQTCLTGQVGATRNAQEIPSTLSDWLENFIKAILF